MDESLREAIKRYRDEERKKQDVEAYIEISKSVSRAKDIVKEYAKKVKKELDDLRRKIKEPGEDLLEKSFPEIAGNRLIDNDERKDPDYGQERVVGVDGSFRTDITVLQRTIELMIACSVAMRGEPHEDPPTNWEIPNPKFVPDEVEKTEKRRIYHA